MLLSFLLKQLCPFLGRDTSAYIQEKLLKIDVVVSVKHGERSTISDLRCPKPAVPVRVGSVDVRSSAMREAPSCL